MGNTAPLSSPPRPTAHRVVIPIKTKKKFSTALSVLPMLHYDAPTESAAGGSRAQTGASVAPVTTSETTAHPETETAVTTSDSQDSLPPQFRDGPISAQEYNEKMQQLQERLAQWKGGKATVLLLCTGLLIVLGFIGAYLTPGFWTSFMFGSPFYIGTICICVIMGFALLVRYMRRESQRLLQDVQDLYRPWRGRGVYVSMKQYANSGSHILHSEDGRRTREQTMSGANCFCIVMNIVNENGDGDEDSLDNFSIGTVMTDASHESGNDEDEAEVIFDDPSNVV